MEKDKKEKIRIGSFRDWIEDKLRTACGELTPDKRFIVVMSFILAGSIGSVYLTVKSIYDMGKSSVQKEFMKIRHIETLELPKREKDSIKINQLYDYGTEESGNETDE